MPTYKITSPHTQREFKIKSDVEKTEDELQRIAYWKEINSPEHNRFPKGLSADSSTSTATKEDISSFQKFMYNFDATDSAVGHFSTWLEADMPLIDSALGTLPGIESGYQKYGRDFFALSPEQRRERIEQTKEQELRRDYPDIYAAGVQDEGGVAAGLGSFAGAIADPTTLIPLGAATKVGALGVGAFLGAGYGFLEEKSRSPEVDFGNVATNAAIGATLSLGGQVLFKTIQKKLAPKGASVDDVNAAQKRTEEVNDQMSKQIQAGKTAEEAAEEVEKLTGRTKADLIADSHVSSTPLIEPNPNEVKMWSNVTSEGITPVAKATNTALGNFVDSMSTQVGRISKPVQLALRKVDLWSHAKTWERRAKVKPFVDFWTGGILKGRNISAEDKALATKYIYNRDLEAAEKVISKYGTEPVKAFKEVSNLYGEMFDELKTGAYKDITKLDNYWHRSVKDWKGLQKALGAEERNLFEELVEKETKKFRASGKLGPKEILPEKEQVRIFNNFFRGDKGRLIRERKLSAAQQRKLNTLDDELIKYYDDPAVSLLKYIDEGTYDHARKTFFGQASKVKGEGTFDTDSSVGDFVFDLVSKKQISPQQADELQELLRIRFINGEKAAGKAVQLYRNTGYLTTLANPFSATIQLADVGVSAYANGLRNTLASMVSPKEINMKELGLDRVLSQEFVNEKVMAKAMHNMFTLSGFRHMDRFGKDVVLNAALRKGKLGALKQNSKFGKQLDQKYKEAFGDEYEALLNELRTNQMTERVKLYLWSELGDVQPISLAEMPVNYLKMKDGRLFYMLKTWTAKQLDLIRRDVRDTWANGDKAQAAKNAVSYSLIVPSFSVPVSYVKDSMLGRDPELDEIEPRFIDAGLKMFGASEYTLRKAARKTGVGDALLEFGKGVTIPPYKHFTDTVNELARALSDDDPDWNKIIRHVPVVGKFYYNFYGPGLDNFKGWEASKD